MDIAAFVTVVSQLGLAAAAFRLASRLAHVVEDLSRRVILLEQRQ